MNRTDAGSKMLHTVVTPVFQLVRGLEIFLVYIYLSQNFVLFHMWRKMEKNSYRKMLVLQGKQSVLQQAANTGLNILFLFSFILLVLNLIQFNNKKHFVFNFQKQFFFKSQNIKCQVMVIVSMVSFITKITF